MRSEESRSWSSKSSVPYIALFVLFALAFAWRMEAITQWPMPFHPTLQYENALNTRALWLNLKGSSATPNEKTWRNGYQGRWKGLPLVEGLTAVVYLLMDKEMPWISGVVTSFLWIVTASLFFPLARRHLHSVAGAWAATCFLLLHSFTVVVSRSYQHEAAALFGFVLAWTCVIKWDVLAGFKNCFRVSLFCGIAMLFKPGVAWAPWCFVLLAEMVHRHGWRRALVSPWLYVTPILTLLPSILWVKFIMPSDETHQWKWALITQGEWYLNTWMQFTTVMGWLPVVLVIVVTIHQTWRGDMRELLILIGCLCYALIFNYACMTHDYYLLAFFPLIALVWGRTFKCYSTILRVRYPHKGADDYQEKQRLWNRLSKQHNRVAAYVASVMITLILSNLGFYWPRIGIYYAPYLSAGPYHPLEEQSRLLGLQLGTGTPVIALTNDYAMPLRYFSGLHAQWWPTEIDLWYEGLAGGKVPTAGERFERMLASTQARYFIVTLENEYQAQEDLIDVLKRYRELPAPMVGVRLFQLRP